MREYFPEFKASNVFENVQFPPSQSLEVRLTKIKEEVGEEFYEELIRTNEEDIKFWNEVKKRYEE